MVMVVVKELAVVLDVALFEAVVIALTEGVAPSINAAHVIDSACAVDKVMSTFDVGLFSASLFPSFTMVLKTGPEVTQFIIS